ncbi:MAG: hypothetical protein GX825_01800 [Syntrophomonadaceae bacterium]|nr:hypothetical protein [Syntrophomonadaceae bacterium]
MNRFLMLGVLMVSISLVVAGFGIATQSLVDMGLPIRPLAVDRQGENISLFLLGKNLNLDSGMIEENLASAAQLRDKLCKEAEQVLSKFDI